MHGESYGVQMRQSCILKALRENQKIANVSGYSDNLLLNGQYICC